MRIRLTARAQRDLLDIWLNIAKENPAAADRVYDCLEERLAILRDFPEAGVTRPELAHDARLLIEPSYSIFYRLTAEFVQFVRVLHGAREIGKAIIAEGIE